MTRSDLGPDLRLVQADVALTAAHAAPQAAEN